MTAEAVETPDLLFQYTAGRWLYNEAQQNSQRYVKFNIEALVDIASKAVGSQCTSITKGTEGSYNKIFIFEFENAKKALARIPNPIAGPSRLITASEVATLDFALNVLQLPVPRVLAWSGERRCSENKVEADFIIMEVAPGVALDDRRKQIKGDEEVLPHLKELASIESKFENVRFSQHGSLYFKDDVNTELQGHPLFTGAIPDRLKSFSERYRIGPISDRQWWRNERAIADLDRGPWPDAKSVFVAALSNQRRWIEQHGNASLYLRRPPYHDASYHFRLLDMAIEAIPHILPPEELCQPTLWHPDLSVGNIHITAVGVPHIEGIIDWQHTCVLPYFYQATIAPAILSNDHPFDLIMPQNIDEFSAEEKEDLLIRQRLFNRFMWYKKHILASNMKRSNILEGPIQGQLMTLLYCGQRTWFDSILELRQALIEIKSRWNDVCVSEATCPILFTDEEMKEHREQWSDFVQYQATMSQIDQHLDIEGDGWVLGSEISSIQHALREVEDAWKYEEQNGYPFPYADGRFSFFLT